MLSLSVADALCEARLHWDVPFSNDLNMAASRFYD